VDFVLSSGTFSGMRYEGRALAVQLFSLLGPRRRPRLRSGFTHGGLLLHLFALSSGGVAGLVRRR